MCSEPHGLVPVLPFCHLPAVFSWASDLASLGLHSLICRRGTARAPSSLGCWEASELDTRTVLIERAHRLNVKQSLPVRVGSIFLAQKPRSVHSALLPSSNSAHPDHLLPLKGRRAASARHRRSESKVGWGCPHVVTPSECQRPALWGGDPR